VSASKSSRYRGNRPTWSEGPGRKAAAKKARADVWGPVLVEALADPTVTGTGKAVAGLFIAMHHKWLTEPGSRTGKAEMFLIGLGGSRYYKDGRTIQLRPGLADKVARSRGAIIRGVHELAEGNYIAIVPGGGLAIKNCGRGGRGKAADREGRPHVWKKVGRGGRQGGVGQANGYCPPPGRGELPPEQHRLLQDAIWAAPWPWELSWPSLELALGLTGEDVAEASARPP